MIKAIDMRSDTVTRPTEKMMQAIANAELGDDVYGEDLSTLKLEHYAAELLGKEDGLLVTSGTMGNLVALLTHTQHRRSEIIAETKSHIVDYEGGNISHFGGVAIKAIDGFKGRLPLDKVEDAIRDPGNLHHPITSLICLENTHANAGGTILPLETIAQLKKKADRYRIPMHLDGARIFNAAVALGKPAADLAKDFDSVQFCISKGLSAPIGSLLVGRRDFIREARHYRKMLGGGMRQCGIIAAPGIVALTDMIDRLQEDHENARVFAQRIKDIPGFFIDMDTVQTNIVCVDVTNSAKTAGDWVTLFEQNGVRCLSRGKNILRFQFHRHISFDEAVIAAQILDRVVMKYRLHASV